MSATNEDFFEHSVPTLPATVCPLGLEGSPGHQSSGKPYPGMCPMQWGCPHCTTEAAITPLQCSSMLELEAGHTDFLQPGCWVRDVLISRSRDMLCFSESSPGTFPFLTPRSSLGRSGAGSGLCSDVVGCIQGPWGGRAGAGRTDHRVQVSS